MKLIDKVKKTNLIKDGDRIIVGVSGGADSITLLSVLAELKDELNLTLFVVHINHGLRKEADFEEEYVRKFSKELGVEFFSKKFDVEKLSKELKKSTEEVGRNIRYEYFNEILNKVNANKIAVAHNLNDSVETFLLNLIRGSGIDGLTGIKKENGNIIRPLIEVTRDEIEEYIEEKNLIAMQDNTNFQTVYTRNKIRNELIPYLKELNPEIVKTIFKTSELLNYNKEIIKNVVKEKYEEIRLKEVGIVLDKEKFLSLDDGLKREILRFSINEFYGSLVDISMSSIENAIYIISSAQSGSIIKVSQYVKIKISYNKLIFFSDIKSNDFCYELNIPGVTYIPEINKFIKTEIKNIADVPDKYTDKNKCFFDIEKTGKKLYVRNKRVGDFFEPTGINGKKSIKKFFSDLKIDKDVRDKIPLVTSDNEVLWVAGFRTSKKFMKDNTTKEVIIFEYGENI